MQKPIHKIIIASGSNDKEPELVWHLVGSPIIFKDKEHRESFRADLVDLFSGLAPEISVLFEREILIEGELREILFISCFEFVQSFPEMFGQPMYPGGGPVAGQYVNYEGKNIPELYVTKDRNPGEERFLRDYILYYMSAPAWVDQKGIQDFFQTVTVDTTPKEMIEICLQNGLDPI